MNNKPHKTLIAIFAMVIMTTTVNLARADESKGGEAGKLQLFSQAQISLSEAIKTAEQKTGGKALEAELDDDSNAVQFEVEIVKDGRIHEVKVDGKTGTVLKVSLDDDSD
ncbi:PepSY domain-containing protein [Methylobacter sp.]|uniref:PepSY domain-containing protein n=1 Tax=Methylobacter sp. TaxID=2051955 RepID=UPI002FDE3263